MTTKTDEALIKEIGSIIEECVEDAMTKRGDIEVIINLIESNYEVRVLEAVRKTPAYKRSPSESRYDLLKRSDAFSAIKELIK